MEIWEPHFTYHGFQYIEMQGLTQALTVGNFTGILYEERGRGILAQVGQKVIIDPKGKKACRRFASCRQGVDSGR